ISLPSLVRRAVIATCPATDFARLHEAVKLIAHAHAELGFALIRRIGAASLHLLCYIARGQTLGISLQDGAHGIREASQPRPDEMVRRQRRRRWRAVIDGNPIQCGGSWWPNLLVQQR